MIAPLRHRQAMAAILLAVCAPLLLAMGLSGRSARDANSALQSEDWGGTVIQDLGYRYRLTRDESATASRGGTTASLLEIDARPGQRIPDVLVYGDDGRAPDESLPATAVLLGPLPPHRPTDFRLYQSVLAAPEHYTIYFVSLMRAGVLGSVDLGPQLGDL